jgi:hypothetical protein
MRLLANHFVEEDSVNQRLKISVLDEPGTGGASSRYEISGFSTVTNPARSPYPDPRNALQIPAVSPRQVAWTGTTILFQNGAVEEVGVNGVSVKALIAIEIDYLRSLQAGPRPDERNQRALKHLEMALDELHARTREQIDHKTEETTIVSGRNVSPVSQTAPLNMDSEPQPIPVYPAKTQPSREPSPVVNEKATSQEVHDHAKAEK